MTFSFLNLEQVNWSMSSSNCCFLSGIQVFQETGKVVWYSCTWRIFQFVVIHAVKSFSIVNEAEADVFLEFPCFLYDPTNADNLISGSYAFPKPSLYIRNFSVHVLLKPGLKDLEHNLTSMWNECNCMVVWTVFDIALLWDWNENWSFPVLWPLLSFPDLLAYWVQQTASTFRIWNSSTGILSLPLALFVVMPPKAHLTSLTVMSDFRWKITPLWLSGSLRFFFFFG